MSPPDEDKTIGEILSTLTEEQLEAVNYLIAAAIDGSLQRLRKDPTKNRMAQYLFGGDKAEYALAYAQFALRLSGRPKRNGTSLQDELRHADTESKTSGYICS